MSNNKQKSLIIIQIGRAARNANIWKGSVSTTQPHLQDKSKKISPFQKYLKGDNFVLPPWDKPHKLVNFFLLLLLAHEFFLQSFRLFLTILSTDTNDTSSSDSRGLTKLYTIFDYFPLLSARFARI